MSESNSSLKEHDEFALPVPAYTLRAAAQSLTRAWNVVHRPQGRSTFTARVEAARAAFDALYGSLARDHALSARQESSEPDPLVEVRENPRLLRSVLAELTSMLKQVDALPRTIDESGEEPRIAAISAAFLNAAGGVWSKEAFSIFITEIQRDEPLRLMELWPFASMLKFILLEELLKEAHGAAASRETGATGDYSRAGAMLALRFKSLREIGHADWVSIIEPLILFDKVLQEDPAGAYRKMDFDSRQSYRKRVADLARYSDVDERKVAQTALDLSISAQSLKSPDPRVRQRRAHIGYYLIDKGAADLRAAICYHPRLIDRLRIAIRNNGDYFYVGSAEILTVLLIGAILAPLMANYSLFGALTLAFMLLLLPATQGAIDLITNTITALFHAEALPKLDFSKGIPAEFTTLVVVPTLLISERQVRDLVESLEVRFLANQDPNLHFALLTDLPDSVTRPRENDTNALVELARESIDRLNARYARGSHGSLMLLHRHRIYNARQEVWMGWERKRGKLLDLNKYLKGEFNAFPVTAGNVAVLPSVRYIITLDSDTQLPRGTAHQLVGAMAHPLNRAIIDPKLRIVTEGYGILQPRVGVSVHSASRSRLAAIYSGQTGFDIYTRAISDAYQDLFGEGIFTGKGIYEVDTFHAVLNRRFPRNSLLSHDLIEGSYIRAGLATDIEVIDDYPSHYSAFTRRKHRWVRGDWQIAQWLFARVPDESGKRVQNPISVISRWKILDNLRRSLVEPFTFLLLLAGWLGLPGGPLYWTVVTLFLLVVPSLVQLGFSLGRAAFDPQPGAVSEALGGFGQALGITFLNLVFLAHQTLLSLDAIARALIRRFVTGQRLLEWETAAEAEANTSKRTPVDRYLAAMPGIAAVLVCLVALINRRALFVALPILILWGFASAITLWLNKAPTSPQELLQPVDEIFLRDIALRIWRFYADFGGEGHNYLIPDNVEEDGLFEAARVSPTNIGMLLNARQAACEFGFVTAAEFAILQSRSLATIARMEKYRGHLYNWYNTRTLEPLRPITISSVDSGNLAASFYTLTAGARSLLDTPVLRLEYLQGLRAYLAPSQLRNPPKVPGEHSQEVTPLPFPQSANLEVEVKWLFSSSIVDSASSAPLPETTGSRIAVLREFVRDYVPWLLPDFSALKDLIQVEASEASNPALTNGAKFVDDLDGRLQAAPYSSGSAEQLRSLLPGARERLTALADNINRIAEDAARLAEEMDFNFLLEKGRGLLSIGYEVETEKLLTACYDMLASEARIATFIAVAKGDIPQQSWFKLGRTHTRAYGRAILLSWTGTMFEYLMPSLWMRSYPDTLVSRTLVSAVEIQRSFASRLNLPWGISESGYGERDAAGHYPYHAFGIPDIALKWDADAGPVIAPYASFLALATDSVEAMRNLRRMADAGWVGVYGFYEAVDFMAGLQNPVLVREWMAHHQGMSLLAILNLLKDNVVQQWFHAAPQLQATELLLHERPMREAALKAEHKEFMATAASRVPQFSGRKDKPEAAAGALQSPSQ
ncbi:MAG TPA: glucoamylase family protein [Acidisarcina sp.]